MIAIKDSCSCFDNGFCDRHLDDRSNVTTILTMLGLSHYPPPCSSLLSHSFSFVFSHLFILLIFDCLDDAFVRCLVDWIRLMKIWNKLLEFGHLCLLVMSQTPGGVSVFIVAVCIASLRFGQFVPLFVKSWVVFILVSSNFLTTSSRR
jgi:hypothetical protein